MATVGYGLAVAHHWQIRIRTPLRIFLRNLSKSKPGIHLEFAKNKIYILNTISNNFGNWNFWEIQCKTEWMEDYKIPKLPNWICLDLGFTFSLDCFGEYLFSNFWQTCCIINNNKLYYIFNQNKKPKYNFENFLLDFSLKVVAFRASGKKLVDHLYKFKCVYGQYFDKSSK